MKGLKQVVWMLACLVVGLTCSASAQEPAAPLRSAYRIEIPCQSQALATKRSSAPDQSSAAKARGDQRPLVVLDFTTTEVEKRPASQQHARHEFRTAPVAGPVSDQSGCSQGPVDRLHFSTNRRARRSAVLACEDIIASEDAELGRAAIDEGRVDEVIRGAYREIVKSRQPLLEAAVRGHARSESRGV